MKRGLLIFVIASTMAGVASAQMLRPALVPTRSPAKAEATPAAKPDGRAAPALAGPTLVARQAPVPMQLAPRKPVAVPETNGQATNGQGTNGQAANDQETNRTETAPAETVPSISDAIAKAAIEADGYKRVRVLSKAEDGIWHARAFRGATEVALRVDAEGNVTTE